MTVGFDTNVFIYSFDPTDPEKHAQARNMLALALRRQPPIPLQVISEALNAAHKKRHLIVPDARAACRLLAEATQLVPVSPQDAQEASSLAERFRLQFFDAQIVAVSRRAGLTMLLSEDMQDGLQLGSLTVINPFDAKNSALIAKELAL